MNINKIVKYGLEEEAIELHNLGIGVNAIADTLRERHPEIHDLQKLSGMSVHRFLKSQNIKEKQLALNTAPPTDLYEEIRAEFRDKMYKTLADTQDIFDIMLRSLRQIIKEGDDYKVIKAARDTLLALEQTRKNWVSLVEYGTNQFATIEKADTINKIEINNLLIDFSRHLCPTCRKNIVDQVILKEQDLERNEEYKQLVSDLVKK